MNGAENLTMTGSSNPRAEQLSWLSEVASAVSKGTLNRHNTSQNQNDKRSSPSTNVHAIGENSSPLLLTSSSSIFSPSALLSRNSEINNMRLFAAPFQVERSRQLQSIPVSSTGATLYYSQAPRSTQYSNFFQATYSSPMSFPSTVSQTTVTNPSVCHPNSQRYLQVDNYPSLVSVQAVGSSHGHVSNSPGYLQHPSSPTNLSLPSPIHQGRFFQHGRSILISRSPEGVVVHSPQERDQSHIQIQLSPVLPQVLDDAPQRKSFTSTDSVLGSSSCSPVADSTAQSSLQTTDFTHLKDNLPNQQSVSPSHIGYKLPTGKEGSLKHRILRPPSISIVDPPQSLVSDAPLSAPPIRTHQEASPKQTRSIPSSGYRSFSSSASSLTETSNRIASNAVSPCNNFTNHRSSFSSGSPSPAPPVSPTSTSLKYPQSFMKGAIIQLANNQLKTVENMTTEDFIECGTLSPALKVDSSTVVSIEKMPSTGAAKLGFQVGQDNIQISVEAPLEHPFFVYKQGWSSCSPERSAQRYGLSCHKLKVGDTCISLTNKLQDPENGEQKCSNLYDANLNVFYKNQNTLTERNTEDAKITSQTMSLCLSGKKCDLLLDKLSSKQDPPVGSRKRKRRWSAPDNFSQSEDGSSS